METKSTSIFDRIEKLNAETRALIEKSGSGAPKRSALAEIMDRLDGVAKSSGREPNEEDLRDLLNGDRALYERYRAESTTGSRAGKSGAVADAVIDAARRLPRAPVAKREDHDAVSRVFRGDRAAYEAYRSASYAGAPDDDAA